MYRLVARSLRGIPLSGVFPNRKAACGPSACNKKTAWRDALSTIVLLSFGRCSLRGTRYENDALFLFFVVPGRYQVYHSYAIQQQKHLVSGRYQNMNVDNIDMKYIRDTSSQVPGMIRHTYATMGTYTIKYSS